MVPYSVDSWKFALRGYSHSLGTRIHGAMISLAAVLPTICITHDTRTRELCEIMKVPSFAANLVRPDSSVKEIFAEVRLAADVFEDNRSTLAKSYDELIRACGFKPSTYFSNGFL
jgi:polysaccharide pyruvyl transferase WcaK-like protein